MQIVNTVTTVYSKLLSPGAQACSPPCSARLLLPGTAPRPSPAQKVRLHSRQLNFLNHSSGFLSRTRLLSKSFRASGMVPGCYFLYYPMKKVNLSKAVGVGRACTFFKATRCLKTACHGLSSDFFGEELRAGPSQGIAASSRSGSAGTLR